MENKIDFILYHVVYAGILGSLVYCIIKSIKNFIGSLHTTPFTSGEFTTMHGDIMYLFSMTGCIFLFIIFVIGFIIEFKEEGKDAWKQFLAHKDM